jgi:GTP cyclohydrolase I
VTGLEDSYRVIIDSVEGEDVNREGLLETPERASRAWRELTSGYKVDVKALLKTFDSDGYDEMVVVADIPFASLCEHHLLPFTGKAHVVYIPLGRIIGLSKIPRLVDAFAQRLQVQERMTIQIADALEENLKPFGVMVVLEAVHTCAIGVNRAQVERLVRGGGVALDEVAIASHTLIRIRSGSRDGYITRRPAPGAEPASP